jgi:hypothetical protein
MLRPRTRIWFPPNIDGFIGKRDVGPIGGEYCKPEDFQYAEAPPLTCTLIRPDVYNAIMAIPGILMTSRMSWMSISPKG